MFESVYKRRQKRDYYNTTFLIEDQTSNSPNYFNIQEIPSTITAGKNIVKVGLNGGGLAPDSTVDLEVCDSAGESLYVEYTGFKDRYDYYYFIVYAYDSTPAGLGTLTLVGNAQYHPDGYELFIPGTEHEREYSVKWSTVVDIRPTERNNAEIHFQKSPKVTVSQVLTPYRFNLGSYSINTVLTTQSLAGLVVLNTDNVGYDLIKNYSEDIVDIEDLKNTYNYFQKSSTTNIVLTNVRKYNSDVINGYVYSEYSRYGAILYDSQSRLTKDMEGSIFSFANEDNGASMTSSWYFEPQTSSYYDIAGTSGSLPTQFSAYRPKIITVLNSKYAVLEKAPTIKINDRTNPNKILTRDLQLTRLYNVTGAFSYPTSSREEIESISLSSSYIQATITDFKPISGDVYRIKTYIKEGGQNTEYYLLNDHIVTPPEFLIDTDKTNQAVYAKDKSDFFTYGEFTDSKVAIDYWRGFYTERGRLQQYSFSESGSNVVVCNFPLANGVRIGNSGSIERGFFSRYYQTYVPDEPYSLSFYCALESGSRLDVFMSSTPLKDSLLGFQAPKAFFESRNTYVSGGIYSRFGKYVGSVDNFNGNDLRFYDNVTFDFFADADGFGRPVFVLKTKTTESINAYVSSISITPTDLVGYTPSILQYASSTPDSLSILQDDEAHLSQSIDVKIEYFSSDGKQSEYVTYIPNLMLNMVNEVPGFCASEASSFNNQAPIYYEIGQDPTNDSVKPNSGTASLDPRLYGDGTFFWPTFSINNAGGYSWNMWSFGLKDTYDVAGLVWNQPGDIPAFFTTPSYALITSSWYRYDPMLPLYNTTIPTTNPADYLGLMYSAVDTPPTYSITPLDQTDSVSAGRLFFDADGAAVSRFDLAQQLADNLSISNLYDIQQQPTYVDGLQQYLRSSRLYFPVTTGSYGGGFYENGGVYNVRFSLSTAPDFSYTYLDNNTPIQTNTQVAQFTKISDKTKYSPDKGAKLMVYIADVASPIPTNKMLIPGVEGFYPPKNNIVTIGNFYGTTPELTFFDSGSGYRIDTYDIILVQYGEKGQLVFDASGLEVELDLDPAAYTGSYKINLNESNALWGGIISDIEWCKIGVTTDPKYIKPTNFDNDVKAFIPKKTPKSPIYVNPYNPVDPKNYVAILGFGLANTWTVYRPYYEQSRTGTLVPTDRTTNPTQPPTSNQLNEDDYIQ